MKEILELMFRTDGTMFVSVIMLIIVAVAGYAILNSFFENVLKPLMAKKPRTKIKKIYVDEYGDEIGDRDIG